MFALGLLGCFAIALFVEVVRRRPRDEWLDENGRPVEVVELPWRDFVAKTGQDPFCGSWVFWDERGARGGDAFTRPWRDDSGAFWLEDDEGRLYRSELV